MSSVFLLRALSGQPLPHQDTQTAAPAEPVVIPPLPNRDGLFRIDVVVTDPAGNPVTDLADFTLLDDGKPTRIFTLQSSDAPQAASEPLPELIFVFDEDGISPGADGRAEDALASYLRRNERFLDQPVALYRIAHDGLFSSSKPSIDGHQLAIEALKRTEPRRLWPAGARSLGNLLLDNSGDRMFRSMGALGMIAVDQREIAGRKVLVWFGDSSAIVRRSCNFNEAGELSTRLREPASPSMS